MCKWKKAQKLLPNDLWWNGPAWVRDPNIWEKRDQYNLNPELPELTESYVVQIGSYYDNIAAQVPRPVRVYLWDSFKTYRANIKFFVMLNRAVKLTRKINFTGDQSITKTEFVEGERLAVKTMQIEHFSDIIDS